MGAPLWVSGLGIVLAGGCASGIVYRLGEGQLSALIAKHFDLRPKGIIQMLDLLRPIYEKTAAYGHFGRDEPEFSWERTDRAALLADAAGIKRRAA